MFNKECHFETKYKELSEKVERMNKIVKEEYGDTLEFLKTDWSKVAWEIGIGSAKGVVLLNKIIKDVETLLASKSKKKG